MANMSYCRFQNTAADLSDCRNNMSDSDLSCDEAFARRRLIKLCSEIAREYEDELEEPFDEFKTRMREEGCNG